MYSKRHNECTEKEVQSLGLPGLKAKYFLPSYLHIDMASYDLSLTLATEEMGGRSLCRQGQTGTHTHTERNVDQLVLRERGISETGQKKKTVSVKAAEIFGTLSWGGGGPDNEATHSRSHCLPATQKED